jgi:cytochrome b561
MTTAPSSRLSHSGYSTVAIALHWTIAALILGNIAGAILNEAVDRATGSAIMAAHKSIGLTVLALSLFRLGWRVRHGFPRFSDATPWWDAMAARTTHVAFYAVMIGLPLLGWMMVSSRPRPLTWFGLFDVPKLPISSQVAEWSHDAHVTIGLATLALVALHVAGALKHHLVDRDDVLARMLPLVRRQRS